MGQEELSVFINPRAFKGVNNVNRLLREGREGEPTEAERFFKELFSNLDEHGGETRIVLSPDVTDPITINKLFTKIKKLKVGSVRLALSVKGNHSIE